MATLAFFRQERVDGGVRTGIDVDGQTVLQDYQPGSDEHDPALLWYVDLRCEGDSLPATAQEARPWLIDHAPAITQALRELAEELTAGIDHELWPYERKVPGVQEGVHTRIVICAVRRLAATELANPLRDIAKNWNIFLDRLDPAPSYR